MSNLTTLMSHLAADEAGAIISAELVLILTIAVLAMVVGLSELASAITCEFFDLSRAFCSLNQTYRTPSFFGCRPKGGWFFGSRFTDWDQCNAFCGQIGVTGYGYGYGDGYGASFVGGPVVETAPAPVVQVAPAPAVQVAPGTTTVCPPDAVPTSPAPLSTTPVCPPEYQLQAPAPCENCPPAGAVGPSQMPLKAPAQGAPADQPTPVSPRAKTPSV